MMTLLAFMITIGILVLIHEGGHFLAAKACGVHVVTFSIGFGPKVWGYQGKGGTEYQLAAIPLGGYVRMIDDLEEETPTELKDKMLAAKPLWQRAVVVIAGPLANLLLAVLLFWGMYFMGLPGVKPIIAEVIDASPAQIAGLLPGDEIIAVEGRTVHSWDEALSRMVRLLVQKNVITMTVQRPNGEKNLRLHVFNALNHENSPLQVLGIVPKGVNATLAVKATIKDSPAEKAGLKPGDLIQGVGKTIRFENWQAFVKWVHAHPGESAMLRILREGQPLEINVTLGARGQEGFIGIIPKIDGETLIRLASWQALQTAFYQTWDIIAASLIALYKILTGSLSWKNLGGPLTIADVAGASASLGLVPYLKTLAVISIGLGVLNLLPIPLLDGGHLLYYIIESIRGHPLSKEAMLWGQKIGLALLGALMLLALYNDVLRVVVPRIVTLSRNLSRILGLGA